MLASERQKKIHETIIKKGAVTTADLVKTYGVSIETIRRDLLSMEQSRLLKRVHGGAVTTGEMRQINSLDIRNEENSREKAELARLALQFINEGDIIGIDTGSTAISLAYALCEKFSNLTVVTHSADVFDIIRKKEGFNIILCGGHYMKSENAFHGNFSLDILSRINMQKAFIFPSAVSLKHGICDYCQSLMQIQKMFFKQTDEIFILADSTKFEKQALLKMDDMKEEYTYITDSNLSEELKKIYKENNLNIITEDM